MTNRRLADLFASVSAGRMPEADGAVEVVGVPTGCRGAICAFTAHTVVAVPVAAEEVRRHLPDGDLGAPLAPVFQAWLASALDAPAGVLDAVLVAGGTGEGKGLLRVASAPDHPRVRRARRYRDELTVWAPPSGEAIVCVGRGLDGRWEVAVEVDAVARGRGVGRRCIEESVGLVPAGEGLFAQVSPGNAASMRAFLAGGFRPVGSEVLFARAEAPGGG